MSEEQKPSYRQERELRDQRLLVCMKEDFDTGFGKIVEHYWGELYHLAYKILEGSGFTYLSEDAVQEALFSAYKDLRRNRYKLSDLHLQHWLFAIVRQKAVECLEQGHKTGHLAGLLGWENEGEDIAARRCADPAYDPAYHLERSETMSEARNTVIELLKSLTDTQREVIVLKYLSPDGTEPEKIFSLQIAERLNRPAGTVRSDTSRALHHMRKRLTAQQGGDRMIHKK